MKKRTYKLTTKIMEKEKHISLFNICFKNSRLLFINNKL